VARSGTSGLGRPKGVPNKLTSTLKDMILGALNDVGGQQYLARCALEAPAPFLALLGRVMPTQQEHSGSILMGLEAIDRPPAETREQWIERRQRELAVSRLALAAPAGNAD
jgi:hypothetical protein